MLGKLFKYDMAALSRILLPVHGGVAIAGVLGFIAGMIGYYGNQFGYDVAPDRVVGMTTSVLSGIMMLFIGLCVLLLFCATVATFVIVLMRFYRNLFTDEGYLTLTLPASPWQQVLAKVLAGLLWMFINAVVVMGCLCLICAGAEGFTSSSYWAENLPLWILAGSTGEYSFFTGDFYTSPIAMLVLWLRLLLQMLFVLLVAYAAFCLGAAAAARHKLAAGIGIFIGIWWAYGFINGIIAVLISVTVPFGSSGSLVAVSMVNTVLQILLMVGAWFICVWVLNRRVNLQ